jgi:hypothetical protein
MGKDEDVIRDEGATAERERISTGLDAIAERYKNAGVFARCVVTDVRKLLKPEA